MEMGLRRVVIVSVIVSLLAVVPVVVVSVVGQEEAEKFEST